MDNCEKCGNFNILKYSTGGYYCCDCEFNSRENGVISSGITGTLVLDTPHHRDCPECGGKALSQKDIKDMKHWYCDTCDLAWPRLDLLKRMGRPSELYEATAEIAKLDPLGRSRKLSEECIELQVEMHVESVGQPERVLSEAADLLVVLLSIVSQYDISEDQLMQMARQNALGCLDRMHNGYYPGIPHKEG